MYKYDAYGTVCVASVRAMEEESGEQGNYYKELLRCVNSVYSNVESIMGDITNSYIQHVSNESTGVIEEMYRKHSRVFCPCRVTVYVSKGLHCWIDGKEYPSYEQYLSDVGQSSYYIRVQDVAVAEVLELSPQCYPWSRHPINPNRNCACNLKITKLTVSYVVNDLFTFTRPLLRCHQHIVRGGEQFLRDIDNGGRQVDHFNDRPPAQHYLLMLCRLIAPLFHRLCYEHMSEWVLSCRDEECLLLLPSSSEEEDE